MDIVSLVLISTTLLGVVVLWIFKFLFSAKTEKKKRYHPYGGTMFHLMLNFENIFDYLTDLARNNSTFRVIYHNNTEIYTTDPTNIEYVLKTNFPNYGKGSIHHDVLQDLVGDGIFSVDGEKWRHQRKMSSYEFSTRNLKDFSSGVFKTNAAKLAQIIDALVASNSIIEIQDLFMKSAMDSVFKVVLGVDLDSLGEANEGSLFSKAFDKAGEITCYRHFDMFWKIKRYLNVGTEATLRKNMDIVNKFVNIIIEDKIQQICKLNKDQMVNKGDILSRFVQMNETNPKYLKDIVLSFLGAGKDTTSTTLAWFFYILCKYPHIQEKIVHEVCEAARLEGKSSIEDIPSSITEEALDKMHFLHAALSETLRLYPAVPVDGKVCFSDDTFPDGFSINKGNVVSYMPYAMGRIKSLWGEDAEEFRPERWLDQNGKFQPESSFKFTAFQGGPRICLGKEFAYRQMKVFASVLLCAFSFKLADEQKLAHYRIMFTLQINGGLHLLATRRTPKSNKKCII